jgi:hypothetical protein
MFAIETLGAVPEKLSAVYTQRVQAGALPPGHAILRGPVGIFLVREDGANGSKLAEEVAGSYRYWDARSSHFFDGVFLGWGFDGDQNDPGARGVFCGPGFAQCVTDLESELDWHYRGGTHLFLTDFVYDAASGQGNLDFSRTISLDISSLLDKKNFPQLSFLIEELIAPVRDTRSGRATTSVWEISDYILLLRTREFWWRELVKKIGTVLGWADTVAPYAVRDLRKDPKASSSKNRAPDPD